VFNTQHYLIAIPDSSSTTFARLVSKWEKRERVGCLDHHGVALLLSFLGELKPERNVPKPLPSLAFTGSETAICVWIRSQKTTGFWFSPKQWHATHFHRKWGLPTSLLPAQ
jgi:hypothetical protein